MDGFYAGASTLAEQLDSKYCSAFYFLYFLFLRPTFAKYTLSSCDFLATRWPPPVHFAESVLVILRDGRHIVGRLISYDHFGTLVLRGARERHVVSAPPGVAASALLADIDIPGLYVVRGENLTLLAEIVRLSCCASTRAPPLRFYDHPLFLATFFARRMRPLTLRTRCCSAVS